MAKRPKKTLEKFKPEFYDPFFDEDESKYITPDAPPIEFYTTKQVAKIFHCTPVVIRKWIAKKYIPYVRVGPHMYRVPNFWERHHTFALTPQQLNRWQECGSVEVGFSPLDVLFFVGRLLALRLEKGEIIQRKYTDTIMDFIPLADMLIEAAKEIRKVAGLATTKDVRFKKEEGKPATVSIDDYEY